MHRIDSSPFLIGLTVVAGCATAALALMPRAAAPAPPTRMAISVPCDTLARCEEVEALAVDVWSDLRAPGMPVDVVVTADQLPMLAARGFTWDVLVADIDADAAAEAARIQAHAALDGGGDWFAEYKQYGAITEHLQELAALAPDRVQLRVIGHSIEGRPILAIRIGGPATTEKPMLVNGTLHAREWIAAMTSTCIADRLVRDYDRDGAVKAYVDRTATWVVPVANPDGYQHAWSANRYWRKNRRGTHGVDLNRNFGVAWGGQGSSSRRGSEIYRGDSAFSEPETRALRDLALSEKIGAHIDFHSYGQVVLYPWAYTSTPAPDAQRFAAVGDRLASALFAPHRTEYNLLPGAKFYPASGIMTDWAYGEAKALSYTIELRPRGMKGLNGFVLPPDQIRPTCDEAFSAVLALGTAKN